MIKTSKVVHFRESNDLTEDLPDNLVAEVMEKGREYGLDDIIPFSTKEIKIAEWVNLKCRYGCSQYNSSWCCPPATPGMEDVRRILGEYKEGLVLVGTQECPEFYHNNKKKRANQVRYWKGIVSLERFLFLKGYYKAFSLVGVTCALCKTCSYPDPCSFPQEKRPTVESFSIDMIGTLKNLGISSCVVNHRKEAFKYYSIILLQ